MSLPREPRRAGEARFRRSVRTWVASAKLKPRAAIPGWLAALPPGQLLRYVIGAIALLLAVFFGGGEVVIRLLEILFK